MSTLRDEVSDQVRIMVDEIKKFVQENPTKILLGGFILGLIMGVMMPRTINIKFEDKRR